MDVCRTCGCLLPVPRLRTSGTLCAAPRAASRCTCKINKIWLNLYVLDSRRILDSRRVLVGTPQHPQVQHPQVQHPQVQHPQVQHPQVQHPKVPQVLGAKHITNPDVLAPFLIKGSDVTVCGLHCTGTRRAAGTSRWRPCQTAPPSPTSLISSQRLRDGKCLAGSGEMWGYI